jgi:hypothetical protein
VKDSNGTITTAGAWHSDSGVRSFIQVEDPTTAKGGTAQPTSGDLWIDPISHRTQTWSIPATGAAGWIPTAVSAPVGLNSICVGSITTPSTFYRVQQNGGGSSTTYSVTFTPPLARMPHIVHCSGNDPSVTYSGVRDITQNGFLCFARTADRGEFWPNDITFVVYI